MHENQETSIPPADDVGRPVKAQSRNAGVYGEEESDPAIVPMKSPNKGPKGIAEVMEGKGRDQGERDTDLHGTDSERGTRVPGFGSRAASGTRKEEGAVHCTVSPSDD